MPDARGVSCGKVPNSWRIQGNLTGIVWPAVTDSWSSTVLAMLFQFEQTQWWSPEQLRRHQAQQLAALCDFAFRTTAFYRKRFDAVGIEPQSVTEPDVWHRVPIVTRAELQQAGASWHSNAPPEDHGEVGRSLTSGSTGRPLLSLGSRLTHFFWCCHGLRDHLWHRRDLSQRLAVIRDTSDRADLSADGKVFDNWGPATDGVVETGANLLLSVDVPIERQAELLQQFQPAYLQAYPTVVGELARWFQSHGETLPSLREVHTFGELLEPQVRDAAREAWDVPVHDFYSAQEVGYMALECPEYQH